MVDLDVSLKNQYLIFLEIFYLYSINEHHHCVKSVRIRSYSDPYFPAFRLNTERYRLSLRIQSECGKIRTRITPNTDTFHAVIFPKMIGYDLLMVDEFKVFVIT